MGLYHDYVGIDRTSEVEYDVYVDFDFIILCVPECPSDSYYEQVVSTWEREVRSFYASE